RQLLALRYYLARSSRELRNRWAWTPAQAARFQKTKEYATIVAEVEKVRTKFAELNPGYTLKVKLELRTLAEQITSWNQMPSVAAAADVVTTTCRIAMNDTAYADAPVADDIKRFKQFLLRCKVTVVPTVAVPGLSQHGQLRAFDFVVMQGDRIIASTETATIR